MHFRFGKLVLGAEDMRVVLRETAHAHQMPCSAPDGS
jgi:hypothetical protein